MDSVLPAPDAAPADTTAGSGAEAARRLRELSRGEAWDFVVLRCPVVGVTWGMRWFRAGFRAGFRTGLRAGFRAGLRGVDMESFNH